MNKHLKHILFFLCFLVSTAQGIHLFGHVLSNHHQEGNKDVIHLLDNHKCSICDISFNPLLPINNQPEFIWVTISESNSAIFTHEKQFQEFHSEVKNPRGPPQLI